MGEIGRLNRETNPIPGEKPGFTPQYKNSDGRFVEVSETNPYPVKLSGGFIEYRILSTDSFPAAKPSEKGAQLLIMDTGEVYFNHGGTWGVF